MLCYGHEKAIWNLIIAGNTVIIAKVIFVWGLPFPRVTIAGDVTSLSAIKKYTNLVYLKLVALAWLLIYG
jgi:hypothetical protein